MRDYHLVLERDIEAQTGVCKRCGPVDLRQVNGDWRCAVQNGSRKRHHLLVLDINAMTGICALCGPVQLGRRSGGVACMTSVLQGRQGIIRNRYGLSADAHEQMIASQQGCCLICGQESDLHVDHDHVTGKVRGLLCGPHNRGLGLFSDDVGLLEAAIAYLKRA